MITDVLRPVSVRFAGAGTSVPSGTLSAVTSDDSDATYIDFNLSSSEDNWSLRLGSHTPSAGYERHRIRGRIRIRTDAGTLNEDIDLGRGTSDYIEFDTVLATSSFAELAGGWYQDSDYGLDTPGALDDLNIGGGWLAAATGGAVETRTSECYVDIDCRFRPDFSAEIRDNAGTDQSGGSVTDTNQPVLYFGTAAYDGLPALDWSVTLTNLGTPMFSSSGTGQPPESVLVSSGLADGSYVATFTVRSTIRGADPFEYSEVHSFDVENTVPPPSPPLVYVSEEFGGYRVEWVNPGGQEWDDGYVVAELFRDDCTGSQRIATVPNSISGSYLDLAIPQLDPQRVQGEEGCETHTDACDITYRVRYWGYVSTSVELPDTLPADMILGWPSTAASIPSGWTRVTALDGQYPRGSSGTAAPVATGGAASHSHTTPGHVHLIGAHSHDLGGSTGSSNSSTTSARFNGASKAQADQPHSHPRPASTGTRAAQNSDSTAPATTAVSNVPPTRDVIWIESDGSQAQYPVGALGWATETVSGWTADAGSSARFLKGAAAAGNGGASTGAATHTHTVNSHIHGGYVHDHTIGNTGLSTPSSSQEAGTGSSTPRWLPRHVHPMNVISDNVGNMGSSSGGVTSAATLEPPNRRLRVLRNTGGGIQTRIIGLYLGAVADLDPLLTLCNGAGGTPDMRTYFARDLGSDSVNSTGGATNHTHTTPSHRHAMAPHNHDITVLASTSSSFEAPTSGDLGDSPTTGHTHTSADTGSETPGSDSSQSGSTSSVSHVPPYHEVHFVRLDGTISGGPLPVPELKVSDFASVTVPSFTYGDDLDRLSTFMEKIAITTDRSHDFPRLVADSVPLNGGLHTISTTLAGEDMTLIIAVEGKPAIDALEALLRSDRVYWSPVGGTPGWYAPDGWRVSAPAPDVKVLSVTMVRQPWPTTPEPSEYL
jgi:hypothetical protein